MNSSSANEAIYKKTTSRELEILTGLRDSYKKESIHSSKSPHVTGRHSSPLGSPVGVLQPSEEPGNKVWTWPPVCPTARPPSRRLARAAAGGAGNKNSQRVSTPDLVDFQGLSEVCLGRRPRENRPSAAAVEGPRDPPRVKC